jgi:hypothetical protein
MLAGAVPDDLHRQGGQPDQPFDRYADVADRWPDPATAQRALSRLQRGGWLKRIERGFYV